MQFRDIIDGLSDEQRRAALTTDNPVMIIAGAGSGKTRTLMGRFAYLVAPATHGGLGADPSSVMMVTFTNKAAKEMRERIAPVLSLLKDSFPDRRIGEPWIGTFHSLSLKILRIESDRAGLSRNFSIFDDSDARSLAADIAEGMGDGGFDLDIFFHDLELAKSRLLTDDLLSEKDTLLQTKAALGDPLDKSDEAWAKILGKFKTQNFVHLYAAYQNALKEQNAVDFSDLMNTVTEVMRKNPAIRDSWRSSFRHFMVDEVQDMNRAQALWLDMFTDRGKEMIIGAGATMMDAVHAADGMHEINGYRVRKFPRPTVAFVGDDDQSIYAFRGSDVTIMRDLVKRYEGMRTCYLNTSYRCQPAILDVANAMVERNPNRFDKTLAPFDPDRLSSRFIVEKHQTPKNEIAALVAEAARYAAAGHDPSEYAVLTRTREHVRVIAKEFRAAGLPVVEGKSSDIRKSAEVRDAMAFAGVLVNPDAETFLRRIINKPSRGLGPTSMSKLVRNARAKEISFTDELRSIMNDRIDLPDGTEPYGTAFIRSVKEFGALIVGLRGKVNAAPDAAEAINVILEMTGYLPDLKKAALKSAEIQQTDALMAMKPREFLMTLLAQKGGRARPKKAEKEAEEEMDLEDLMDRTSALSETARRIGNLSLLMDQAKAFPSLIAFVQESTLEMEQGETQAGFRLMTIHASKGLEFERVRLPFWIEGIMPHGGSSDSEQEVEEELRLAYVAVTRAKETVKISYCDFAGRTPFIRVKDTQESRFIGYIRDANPNHWMEREIRNQDDPCYKPGSSFMDQVGCTPEALAAALKKGPQKRRWGAPSSDIENMKMQMRGQTAANPDYTL